MKQTYSIPQDRREEVEKLVAKYQKKAAKYGVTLTAEYATLTKLTRRFLTSGTTQTLASRTMTQKPKLSGRK